MSFRAPVADIAHTLKSIAGLGDLIESGMFPDLSDDLVDAVLEEAGRFATDVIAPLNRSGDIEGAKISGGDVTLPEGWKDAYLRWVEGGWGALPGPVDFGGQGLPVALAVAVQDMWNSASMAFGIGTVLTAGAVEALTAHGSDELQTLYLPKLVSGEWTGTMNLTEPQAGSDLALLRAKAVPNGDGTYAITGTKIFITYGEHDLTDNIVHLVLARLPDAPEGTRGISLFVVPKFIPEADGTPGRRNDVRCVGLEHKLGIHGSATCTMAFGEDGGATGWLVGEENKGLACMFTMMNNARLHVGIQGVAIAERAFQQALAYAGDRRQGRKPGMGATETVAIIEHPDVRRNLMTMRALTAAARAICYLTANAIDRAHHAEDGDERSAALERANLLTPIAKAFSTDIGTEVASIGVQVHGGMGYIEETGAAQHLRDARIAQIYEGTNGIQAIDLVTRKITQSGGAAVAAYLGELDVLAKKVAAANTPDLGGTATRLTESIEHLRTATGWLQEKLSSDPDSALAGATPYLELFGLASGGTHLAAGALAANGDAQVHAETARFFAENLMPKTSGLLTAITSGAGALRAANTALKM
ncbi:MAG: acyl-CoA dehydrogenase family protein [Tepidamorphaceae bacterium]|nr:acyl-CoA dehydrogenase C-terminal domain-containing protein [Rhodobiaceae bacterium]MCC0049438.1 acyl-CoA dehydrogenase C-terminal domain-containing protein [Rhodobiaceae bacterium]